jgi:hypothetical protein
MDIVRHNDGMAVSDPQLIANLVTLIQAAQVDAQNLLSGSYVRTERGQEVFMLEYMRLHERVEEILNRAGESVATLEQLQTARHRSLVAGQVAPQHLYREVAGEINIVTRVLDDLLAGLSATSLAGATETSAGVTFTSDTGKRYTYHRAQTLGLPGRFSQVYRGADEGGTAVAVKRLLIRTDSTLHRAADEQQAERELQVAQHLATVPGSHIMPILDYAHLDGELLLVMPLADHSLADKIRQDPLAAPAVKDLLRQIASALQELATVAVVHRDVKPGNILWYQGRWHLADFGISRIMSAATATFTFRGTGTLEYLAPEAWNFGPQTVASDLYALGCVGYEALVGQRAFDGDDLGKLHATHMPVLPNDADPVLVKVISLLLAKSPDHRPPDARKVAELLEPRDELTRGQRSLQRLSAIAAERTLQRGSHDALLIQRHEQRGRARAAFAALWRDLMDHVREAVPDAVSTEDECNYSLIVGNTRLRLRLDDVPPAAHGGVLLAAEVYIEAVGAAGPRLAANLASFWQSDRPVWHLAQFVSAGEQIPGGIPALDVYQAWRSPEETGSDTAASVVLADPAAIIELYGREAEA